MTMMQAEQLSCSSMSLIFTAVVWLEIYSTDWTYPNGVPSRKGSDTKPDSCAVSTQCSPELLISLPALLFLLLSSPKNKSRSFSACFGGSAISSYLMLTEEPRERVLPMVKLILGGFAHLSLGSLSPSLMGSVLEVRSFSFSLVHIWNSSSNFESKRCFYNWKVSVLCYLYQENFHFLTFFVIWGPLRMPTSFEDDLLVFSFAFRCWFSLALKQQKGKLDWYASHF